MSVNLKMRKDGKPRQRRQAILLECNICCTTFKRRDYLLRHVKKHEEAPSICKFCNKLYANEAHLKKHEMAHVESAFCCRYCIQSFASEDGRNQHVKAEHHKNCVCPGCKSRFYTEESLARHRKTFCGNETNQFVCESCGKQFKLKGNLKVHTESKCGTERTYKCNECGKSFMTRPSLGTHRLLHTGEKRFVCRFCGKAHRTKGEVKRHELTHTHDKPFVCKVCLKAFAHRESLITHSTLHTGVKPYICDGCGRGFSCMGNLIKHRKNYAKCMTSDSQRNKPRIKKPSVHSLLVDYGDLEVCQNERIPFTTVGPYVGLTEQCIENNLPTIHYTIGDTFLSLPKPVMDLDLHVKPAQQLREPLQERKEEDKECDVDRTGLLTNDATVNDMIAVHSEISNSNHSTGHWDINSKSRYTDPLQNEFANYNDKKPICKSPLKTSLIQTLDNSIITSRKQNSARTYLTALQPFVNVDVSSETIIRESSENAATMQSRCVRGKSSFVGAATDGNCPDEDWPSAKSEKEKDMSADEPLVECKVEEEDLDGNSSNSGSVSANVSTKIDEHKLELLYEDQYLSWVKSSKHVLEDAAKSKETAPVILAPLNTPAVTLKSNKDGVFTCSSCPKCFNEEERLRWHMKTHDSRFLDNKKHEVGYISEDDEPLNIRLQRHILILRVNQEFPCQYCAKLCKSEADYKRHKTKHHANAEKPSFPCPHCPKVYKFRRALLRHELLHTGGIFQCKKCDQRFTTFKEHQFHLRTYHWKKFPCEQCGHSFLSSSELNSHIVCNHTTGEKRLSCETCGKLFKHNVNLKRHVESRCGASPRFVCKTCGKSYLSQGGFESHQRTHAGTRVFLCKYCGRDFQHKSVLLIHELTHTGEKPFVCAICSKAFAHNISLTTHATVHSGVKPYRCEGCGAGFSCFGNLKKHRLTHMSTCSLTRIRKSKGST